MRERDASLHDADELVMNVREGQDVQHLSGTLRADELSGGQQVVEPANLGDGCPVDQALERIRIDLPAIGEAPAQPDSSALVRIIETITRVRII